MNLGLPVAALYCFDKALEINPRDAQIIDFIGNKISYLKWQAHLDRF
jgi:hypothetical protein